LNGPDSQHYVKEKTDGKTDELHYTDQTAESTQFYKTLAFITPNRRRRQNGIGQQHQIQRTIKAFTEVLKLAQARQTCHTFSSDYFSRKNQLREIRIYDIKKT
jgi:hypothetical protein